MIKAALKASLASMGYTISRSSTVKALQLESTLHAAELGEARAQISILERELTQKEADLAQRHVIQAEASGFHRGPKKSPVMDAYSRLPNMDQGHAAGAFGTDSLQRLESLLPASIEASAETGCGKSTILFSNISSRHKVFAYDDRDTEHSSVKFFEECPLTKIDRVETVFGPTQQTLPAYRGHQPYDVVLIDGPHGFPFPELEYYFFYPHIKPGGFLILDDVCIPSIGRMADILAEDPMFELVEIIQFTAVFQRTNAPTFDPLGDGWWLQRYNRRRVSPARDIHIDDGPIVEKISSLQLDVSAHRA